MNKLKNILVGVDFSECSRSALVQAVRLAEWNNATLHVLHVVRGLVVLDLAQALGTDHEKLEAEAIRDARDQAEDLVSSVGGWDKTEIIVRAGSPIEVFLEVTESTSADLLVLGVFGSSGASVGAGTFSTKCVRKAKTKVMLVHQAHTSPFRSIVACVDFSETSRRALAQATTVARKDGSRLRAVHVYYGPWHRLHYRSPTPEASPAFQRQYLDRLNGLFEEFVAPFSDQLAGIDFKAELHEHQSYGRGVVEYAGRQDADLVVLGTEGNSNLRYLFLGSTAERVLRELPCSVLTVKPAKYTQDSR